MSHWADLPRNERQENLEDYLRSRYPGVEIGGFDSLGTEDSFLLEAYLDGYLYAFSAEEDFFGDEDEQRFGISVNKDVENDIGSYRFVYFSSFDEAVRELIDAIDRIRTKKDKP